MSISVSRRTLLTSLLGAPGASWAQTYTGTGYGLGRYRIDENLKGQRVHVHDGTYANRLIHKESNQCFIGPYAIDAKGN